MVRTPRRPHHFPAEQGISGEKKAGFSARLRMERPRETVLVPPYATVGVREQQRRSLGSVRWATGRLTACLIREGLSVELILYALMYFRPRNTAAAASAGVAAAVAAT